MHPRFASRTRSTETLNNDTDTSLGSHNPVLILDDENMANSVAIVENISMIFHQDSAMMLGSQARDDFSNYQYSLGAHSCLCHPARPPLSRLTSTERAANQNISQYFGKFDSTRTALLSHPEVDKTQDSDTETEESEEKPSSGRLGRDYSILGSIRYLLEEKYPTDNDVSSPLCEGCMDKMLGVAEDTSAEETSTEEMFIGDLSTDTDNDVTEYAAPKKKICLFSRLLCDMGGKTRDRKQKRCNPFKRRIKPSPSNKAPPARTTSLSALYGMDELAEC
jgi:hypothetical protein